MSHLASTGYRPSYGLPSPSSLGSRPKKVGFSSDTAIRIPSITGGGDTALSGGEWRLYPSGTIVGGQTNGSRRGDSWSGHDHHHHPHHQHAIDPSVKADTSYQPMSTGVGDTKTGSPPSEETEGVKMKPSHPVERPMTTVGQDDIQPVSLSEAEYIEVDSDDCGTFTPGSSVDAGADTEKEGVLSLREIDNLTDLFKKTLYPNAPEHQAEYLEELNTKLSRIIGYKILGNRFVSKTSNDNDGIDLQSQEDMISVLSKLEGLAEDVERLKNENMKLTDERDSAQWAVNRLTDEYRKLVTRDCSQENLITHLEGMLAGSRSQVNMLMTELKSLYRQGSQRTIDSFMAEIRDRSEQRYPTKYNQIY